MPLTPEDMRHLKEPVADLMAQACADLVLPRFRALSDDQIQSKSNPNDLVTVADIEAEAWLAPRLCELLPGSLALGEEAASRGEIASDILSGSEPVWTIDPVDGTYNFVHGSPDFCCMIGLVQDRVLQAGWILFPTDGRLYWAGKGMGAVRQQEGEEVRLSIDAPATKGALSHRFFRRPELKDRKADIVASLAPTMPTSCAGLNYSQAAESKLGFVAMATLTPWDHAPGTLLVQEAGGEVWLNGGTYDPLPDLGTLIAGGHNARMRQAQNLLGHPE